MGKPRIHIQNSWFKFNAINFATINFRDVPKFPLNWTQGSACDHENCVSVCSDGNFGEKTFWQELDNVKIFGIISANSFQPTFFSCDSFCIDLHGYVSSHKFCHSDIWLFLCVLKELRVLQCYPIHHVTQLQALRSDERRIWLSFDVFIAGDVSSQGSWELWNWLSSQQRLQFALSFPWLLELRSITWCDRSKASFEHDHLLFWFSKVLSCTKTSQRNSDSWPGGSEALWCTLWPENVSCLSQFLHDLSYVEHK